MPLIKKPAKTGEIRTEQYNIIPLVFNCKNNFLLPSRLYILLLCVVDEGILTKKKIACYRLHYISINEVQIQGNGSQYSSSV